MNKKEIYVHAKQLEFLQDEGPLVNAVLGTRASGKTGALAYRFYQRSAEMPRGRFFLGAGTIDQLLNNVIPNIFQILEETYSLQLIEGEDYVICQKAPKFFTEPLQKPKRYDNVIFWSNGAWTELITPRKLQPFRGANTDGGDIDEGLLWTWKDISGVLLPTFRGNKHRFKKSKLHHNLSIYSSLPRTPEAMWLTSMEKKAQSDSQTYSYFFFSWKDNTAVIGEDYGDRMKKSMDPVEYSIEIEGNINIRTGEEYYHAFDYKRHTYIVSHGLIESTHKTEYDPYSQIDLSFDFGGNFNCMWIIQPQGLEIRCIDSMFVKFKEKLPILIKKFCNHPRYEKHKNKIVNLYGEPHGTNQREDNVPLFEQVQKIFIKYGWEAVLWVEPYDKASLHKERFIDMNEILAEEEDTPYLPYIRINADTCEDAIVAIQKTKVTLEHKKDKSMEKTPERFPQEHAPHFTDALDNYRRQKYEGTILYPGGGSSGNAGIA